MIIFQLIGISVVVILSLIGLLFVVISIMAAMEGK